MKTTRLPRCTPAQAGLDPKWIVSMIDDMAAKDIQLTGFMLVRHGKVLCEGHYAPYLPDQLRTVFSLSKTFTSMAVGIAWGEGILDLDERVIDLFPEALEKSGVTPGKELSALTLRHLLRMSTGQPAEPECEDDFPQDFLRGEFADMPGEVFRYNTMATYMLSAALKQKGIDLEEYLEEKLLAPMGIEGTRWQRDGSGTCMGGFGFSLVPEVIAKLGVLILQNGRWEGKQLVPEAYLKLATAKQIDNGDGGSEWNHGYGYQMWMCSHNAFRGDGMYGQLCIMHRETDSVLAVTAVTGDMGTEMQVCFDDIVTRYADAPLEEDEAAMRALEARLQTLRFTRDMPEDDGAPIPSAMLNRKIGPEGFALELDRQGRVSIRTEAGQVLAVAERGVFHTEMLVAGPAEGMRCRKCSPVMAAYGMMEGVLTVRMYDVEFLQEVTVTMREDDAGIRYRVANTTANDGWEIMSGVLPALPTR